MLNRWSLTIRESAHSAKNKKQWPSLHKNQGVNTELIKKWHSVDMTIHWQFSQYCYHRLLMFSLNTQSPLCLCGYYWPSWPFLPLLNKYNINGSDQLDAVTGKHAFLLIWKFFLPSRQLWNSLKWFLVFEKGFLRRSIVTTFKWLFSIAGKRQLTNCMC